MARAIKLKNNDYIDSTGIVHNRQILANKLLLPYTLYESAEGSTGNFEISDNRRNYKYLEIYYGNSSYYRKITEIHSEEVYVPLMIFYDASWGMQIQTCQFIIRGTSAQRANDKYINCNISTGGSVVCGMPSSPAIKIYKVVGYK